VYHELGRNVLEQRALDENMKIGNVKIAAMLCELPKTKHDLKSFAVDMNLVNVSHLRKF
jgi:hypothetical protein